MSARAREPQFDGGSREYALRIETEVRAHTDELRDLIEEISEPAERRRLLEIAHGLLERSGRHHAELGGISACFDESGGDASASGVASVGEQGAEGGELASRRAKGGRRLSVLGVCLLLGLGGSLFFFVFPPVAVTLFAIAVVMGVAAVASRMGRRLHGFLKGDLTAPAADEE